MTSSLFRMCKIEPRTQISFDTAMCAGSASRHPPMDSQARPPIDDFIKATAPRCSLKLSHRLQMAR